MATIMSKRGQLDNVVTYEHICDTKADLNAIDSHYATLGSIAIVLNQGSNLEVYMADSNGEWKLLMGNSGSGGGSDGGSSSEITTEMLEKIMGLTAPVLDLTKERGDIAEGDYFVIDGELVQATRNIGADQTLDKDSDDFPFMAIQSLSSQIKAQDVLFEIIQKLHDANQTPLVQFLQNCQIAENKWIDPSNTTGGPVTKQGYLTITIPPLETLIQAPNNSTVDKVFIYTVPDTNVSGYLITQQGNTIRATNDNGLRDGVTFLPYDNSTYYTISLPMDSAENFANGNIYVVFKEQSSESQDNAEVKIMQKVLTGTYTGRNLFYEYWQEMGYSDNQDSTYRADPRRAFEWVMYQINKGNTSIYLGDYLQVQFNEHWQDMRICNINSDSSVDWMAAPQVTMTAMNSSGTYEGLTSTDSPFLSSDLYKFLSDNCPIYLQDSSITTIPGVERKRMGLVSSRRRYATTSTENPGYAENGDNGLWTPSEMQLFGHQNYRFSEYDFAADQQLQLFKQYGGYPTDIFLGGSYFSFTYWLRNPTDSNTNCVVVTSDGSNKVPYVSTSSPSTSNSIFFGCTLKVNSVQT